MNISGGGVKLNAKNSSFDYLKSTIPVVDEDGFRLDASGNKLYK